MSNPMYDKPPPYTPHPQEGIHQPYAPGYVTQIPPPAPYQPIVGQPVAPNYGATVITIGPQQPTFIGTCPACRVGFVEDDFTCLGILCAIFFFPIGILFCLLLKDRRCANCGAYFG